MLICNDSCLGGVSRQRGLDPVFLPQVANGDEGVIVELIDEVHEEVRLWRGVRDPERGEGLIPGMVAPALPVAECAGAQRARGRFSSGAGGRGTSVNGQRAARTSTRAPRCHERRGAHPAGHDQEG